MKMNEIKQLLKQYGLKLTLIRIKLLEIFLYNDAAVSYPELLRLTNEVFDRVSVYRTLKAFEGAGIIHRIASAASSPSYALSELDNPEKQAEQLQHLHFSCIKCNSIYCLYDQLAPSVILPDAYEVHSLSMIIVGICRVCNEKSETLS